MLQKKDNLDKQYLDADGVGKLCKQSGLKKDAMYIDPIPLNQKILLHLLLR